MNSRQFQQYLAKQGCTFEAGKGGHKIVRRGKLKSVVPTHGGRKKLGTGLINKVKKDLGLK